MILRGVIMNAHFTEFLTQLQQPCVRKLVKAFFDEGMLEKLLLTLIEGGCSWLASLHPGYTDMTQMLMFTTLDRRGSSTSGNWAFISRQENSAIVDNLKEFGARDARVSFCGMFCHALLACFKIGFTTDMTFSIINEYVVPGCIFFPVPFLKFICGVDGYRDRLKV